MGLSKAGTDVAFRWSLLGKFLGYPRCLLSQLTTIVRCDNFFLCLVACSKETSISFRGKRERGKAEDSGIAGYADRRVRICISRKIEETQRIAMCRSPVRRRCFE